MAHYLETLLNASWPVPGALNEHRTNRWRCVHNRALSAKRNRSARTRQNHCVATVQDPKPYFRLQQARWLGGFLTLAVISVLSMAEIGSIIGDVSVAGGTYPADSLYNLAHVWQASTAVHEWARAACSGVQIRGWLWWQLGFDVPFIVGYAGFLLGANRRWPELKIFRLVVVVVLADLVEDVLTAGVIRGMPGPGTQGCDFRPGLVFGLLIPATLIKTVGVGAILVRTGWMAFTKDTGHEGFRRLLKALGLQRFILFVVSLLAVLLLLPGAPILEQGVDVERSWVLDTHLWPGITPGLWAIAMMGVLAAGLRYLASVRTAAVRLGAQGAQPAEAAQRPGSWSAALVQSRVWLIAAAAVSLGLFVLGHTPVARVYWHNAIWVAVVLFAVPLLTAIVATRTPLGAIDGSPPDVRRLAYKIGRALGGSVMAILLISFCRSLVAPMILLDSRRALCFAFFFGAALIAIGFAVTFLWSNRTHLRDDLSKGRFEGRFDFLNPQLVGTQPTAEADAATADAESTAIPTLLVSILPSVLVTVFCAAVLLFYPLHTSRLLGVVGTLALCLLLLTGFYATLQIVAQITGPPYFFSWLGFQRTPIVTLALLVGLLSTVFGTDSSLHDIRRPAAATTISQRPDLHRALATWLAGRDPGCAIPLDPATATATATATAAPAGTGARPPRSSSIQPLILVAAEGGGIRATWWTVDAMTSMTSTACGRSSLFLASGVSGGAVGLALMARSAHPYTQMKSFAAPDALSVGTAGLLSRDLVAGALGINLRAQDSPADARFSDRAGLMEEAWQRKVPDLAQAFPANGQGRSVPWYTVFNGTSVANTCRVLVSDVRLTSSTRCDDPTNQVPGSYDLFGAQPCLSGVSSMTASLLAARFPYVTPSGVVRSCDGKSAFQDQIIDGGYSENTGLDTLNGALVQMMPDLRTWNLGAMKRGEPLVVPLVVFLHNTVVASDGGLPKAPKATLEAIVPPFSRSDSSILGENSTLLQRAGALARTWLPDADGPDAEAQAQQWRLEVAHALQPGTRGVLTPQSPEPGTLALTVAPQRTPALSLPLGWTLSGSIEASLDKAFDAYLRCTTNCAQSATFDNVLRLWHTPLTYPVPPTP
jgi:hypothetical protein